MLAYSYFKKTQMEKCEFMVQINVTEIIKYYLSLLLDGNEMVEKFKELTLLLYLLEQISIEN